MRDHRVQRHLVTTGLLAAVVAFGVGQVSTFLLGPMADSGWTRLLTGAAHGQMPLWLVSSVGSAILVIGVMLRAWPRISQWASPLAYVGQMAFTFYVAHILVIAAMGGRIDSRLIGIPVTIGMLVVFATAATWWVPRRGTGPLERILRANWLSNLTRGAA